MWIGELGALKSCYSCSRWSWDIPTMSTCWEGITSQERWRNSLTTGTRYLSSTTKRSMIGSWTPLTNYQSQPLSMDSICACTEVYQAMSHQLRQSIKLTGKWSLQKKIACCQICSGLIQQGTAIRIMTMNTMMLEWSAFTLDNTQLIRCSKKKG